MNTLLTVRKKLQAANADRKIVGKATSAEIAAWFYNAYKDTKEWPLVKEAATTFSVGKKTVCRAVKSAGIELPREELENWTGHRQYTVSLPVGRGLPILRFLEPVSYS